MSQVARREFESLAAAAERTGISVKTLRRRISEGRLVAYRGGPRLIRVDPADVDRMLVQIPNGR
jgi:excisionase family DNA binding protein